MRHRNTLGLAGLISLLAGMANAQTYGYGTPQTPLEQHRLAIQRQQILADGRQALAERYDLEARLAIQQLQASRQLPTVLPSEDLSGRDMASARTRRLIETRRRMSIVDGSRQIDDWLDRPAGLPE